MQTQKKLIDKTAVLLPDYFYHVFTRANGSERIFLKTENYNYFLEKYKNYISPIAATYCYCLMPNHIHFLIKIRPQSELVEAFQNHQLKKTRRAAHLQGFRNLEGVLRNELDPFLSEYISNQFSNLLNGYAKAFNKLNNRMGSLFMHTFKRKQINDHTYLRNAVLYIHKNPVESNLCKSLTGWKYSSYHEIIAGKDTFGSSEEVISWFHGLENFRFIHENPFG